MGRTVFGDNSKKVVIEKEQINSEYQNKVKALQLEIMHAQEKLKESEAKQATLQSKLEEYQSKERQIAEVMINAQISAQKTEAQARARAEVLIQETDEELRHKNRELELLRIQVQLFKQDIYGRIDQYKSSLDKIMDPNEEIAFTPTLVTKEKNTEKKLIG